MKPVENVSYWRNSNLEGVETCQVIKSMHAFPNHSHENIFAIGLMEEGGSYCLGPGKRQRSMKPGEITLINPSQIHSGVPLQKNPMSYRMLYFSVELMTQIARDIFEDDEYLPEFERFVIQDRLLFTLLKLLSKLLVESAGKLELDSFIIETLSNILRNYGGRQKPIPVAGNEPDAIRHAKEYLSNRLSEKISLVEVSKAVGLSQYHFLRTFKRETGLSPHLFRTQQRLEKARNLLKEGIPFSEIALSTGFSDQSHFNNKFRQFTGATPRQYLANHLS